MSVELISKNTQQELKTYNPYTFLQPSEVFTQLSLIWKRNCWIILSQAINGFNRNKYKCNFTNTLMKADLMDPLNSWTHLFHPLSHQSSIPVDPVQALTNFNSY